MRFSRIVDHIEHHHFLYREGIIGYLESGRTYKYSCDRCAQGGFSYYSAMTHFLVKHVEHSIFCLQCIVIHPEENFHIHINECNTIEEKIRGNDNLSI